MIKRFLLSLLFLTIATSCYAFDEWSKRDFVMQSISTTTILMDWSQTRYIARHPKLFHENNPILGEHPSVGKVDVYFMTSIVVSALITHVLPSEWRPYWQTSLIISELVFVGSNAHVGIKMRF